MPKKSIGRIYEFKSISENSMLSVFIKECPVDFEKINALFKKQWERVVLADLEVGDVSSDE